MSNASYMCRTIRPTRVFLNPSDMKPTSIIMNNRTMFISNDMINHGTVTLFKISEAVDTSDIPIGYWVAGDVIEYFEIKNDDIKKESTESSYDDSIACNDNILINGSNVSIYNTKDSLTPIIHGLKLGDIVTVTRKVKVIINGREEIRYLISDAPDQNMIGKWILENYSVAVNGYEIKYHNQVKLKARTVTTPNNNTRDRAPVPTVENISTPNTTLDTTNPNTSEMINNMDPEAYQQAQMVKKTMQELFDTYNMDYATALNSTMSVPIGRMVFVHGMPFQYTYLTDRRVGSEERLGRDIQPNTTITSIKDGTVDMYGRIFAKEIAANMPIVTIVPGTPSFMTNISHGLLGYTGNQSAKNNWVPFWSDLSSDEFDSALANLMNSGRNRDYMYYSMNIDTTEYFNYVNAMCRTSAKLMGLYGVPFHKTTCDKMDWAKYNTSADQDYTSFEEVVGLSGGVSFAFDPVSSITDSLSNSVTESQFSGMIRGLSDKARELEFMTGTAGISIDMVDSIDYEGATANVTSGMFSGARNAVNRLTTLFKNTAHGMNVKFPQLWSDSQYSKSYSVEMHFIAPYATAFCKWRYVLVPFFTVFCLAAPQSPSSVINYKRPFLIRAFSKGYFNVEMGIIESISWRRFGDGDMISEDGIPTQIDVTIDFQDLYQQLAISKFESEGGDIGNLESIDVFFNNTGLMDMLGQLSGVNMNKITLGERLSLYVSTAAGAFSISGVGSNFMEHISDRVRNIMEPFMYGM